MTTTCQPQHRHRGTFATGESDPSTYPEDTCVGTFDYGAGNRAPREATRVGTFADGLADPRAYRGEERVGTFADTARRARNGLKGGH
jgi:hypothetical protein